MCQQLPHPLSLLPHLRTHRIELFTKVESSRREKENKEKRVPPERPAIYL
jgi:hypothetical protein